MLMHLMHLHLSGLNFPNLALCLNPVFTCLALAAALRATAGCTFTSNDHFPSRCQCPSFLLDAQCLEGRDGNQQFAAQAAYAVPHDGLASFGSGGGGSVLRFA